MTLELGIFLPVANNGWILSAEADPAPPTFELNRRIALEAERRGFEFLLAQSVWRGHGGVTGFWDTSLECFTIMTALGVATERIKLIASVQPLLYPPAVAAKMVATADDVCRGRFGINIVAGANLSEYEQMGLLPDGWGDIRYDYATEWIGAVKRLWGAEPAVDVDGDWIHLTDCRSNPVPATPPPVFCAGSSARGMAFAVEHGTHAFVGAATPELLAETVCRYREAAAGAGRELTIYTVAHLLIADSDEEAAVAVQHYRDHPDVGAVADLLGQYSRDGAGESLRKGIVESGEHVFFGGLVAGSATTVASYVQAIADADVDGLLVMFPDWDDGLRRFCDDVLTLVPHLRTTNSADLTVGIGASPT